MTVEEFIESNPNLYGNNNVNLFYSSSVSASIPQAPFTIKGISVQSNSGNGIDIDSALKGVETFRFDFSGTQLEAPVNGRIKRAGYIYFSLLPTVTNTLPTDVDVVGNTIERDSEFIFIPYIQTNFNNNDYNPLMNNSEGSKTNVVAQVVDRTTDAIVPTNLDAILSGNAEAAEIQNCSYTKRAVISSRYLGSKTSAAGPVYSLNKDNQTTFVINNTVSGSAPATPFKFFEGSQHTADASTSTVKAISTSDRDILEVYFDSVISGSHPNKTYPSFPTVGNYLFQEVNNQFQRLPGKKVFSIDKNEVYTTDDFGQVTLVE